MVDISKENRAYQRQEYETTLNIRMGEERISGKLRNISPAGAKFSAKEFIMPMTRLAISLPDESPLEFTGIVAWTLRINSHCEAGIFFQDLTPEQGQWLENFCARISPEE